MNPALALGHFTDQDVPESRGFLVGLLFWKYVLIKQEKKLIYALNVCPPTRRHDTLHLAGHRFVELPEVIW